MADMLLYVVPSFVIGWLGYRALAGQASPEEPLWLAGAMLVSVCALVGATAADLGTVGTLGSRIGGKAGRYASEVADMQGYRAELTHNLLAAVVVICLAAPLLVFGAAGKAAMIAAGGGYGLHLIVDWLTGRHAVSLLPAGPSAARAWTDLPASSGEESGGVGREGDGATDEVEPVAQKARGVESKEE